MSFSDETNEEPRDTPMIVTELSNYPIALDSSIFDLDYGQGFDATMLDPSYEINSVFHIEFTYLTVSSLKVAFFWINSDHGFTGILVSDPLKKRQLEHMKKRFSEREIDLDLILLDFSYFQGTQLGLLKNGRFLPYILLG